ncbi:MAG: response regulator [Rhizomicrobium sp.]
MNTLRKVLVVDDDPVISKSFNRVLAGKGYIVVSAENGQEALNKVASEQYDAVFTDIRMPGMDGIEVAEKLRASQPWTPVVIITGYGSPDNEARAGAAGVSGFLHKPLSPEMIKQSVEAAVAAAQPAPAAVPQAVAAAAAQTTAKGRTFLRFMRDVAMFFASPFIGLAFIALFPLIGLAMLVWTGGQALRSRVTSG